MLQQLKNFFKRFLYDRLTDANQQPQQQQPQPQQQLQQQQQQEPKIPLHMKLLNVFQIIFSIAMPIAVIFYFYQVYTRRNYVIYNLFKLKFNTTNISNFSECVETTIKVEYNTNRKMVSKKVKVTKEMYFYLENLLLKTEFIRPIFKSALLMALTNLIFNIPRSRLKWIKYVIFLINVVNYSIIKVVNKYLNWLTIIFWF